MLYPWHVGEVVKGEKKTRKKKDDSVCVCNCVFWEGQEVRGWSREQIFFVWSVLSLRDDQNPDINLFTSVMLHHYKGTEIETYHFLKLKKLQH